MSESERIKTDRNLIEPIYSQSRSNEPIDIGSVPVRFTFGGSEYRKIAAVGLRFSPTDRLFFSVPVDDMNPLLGFQLMAMDDWSFKIFLEDRNLEFEMLCAGVGGDLDGAVDGVADVHDCSDDCDYQAIRIDSGEFFGSSKKPVASMRKSYQKWTAIDGESEYPLLAYA